jgi:hypothetical protein
LLPLGCKGKLSVVSNALLSAVLLKVYASTPVDFEP